MMDSNTDGTTPAEAAADNEGEEKSANSMQDTLEGPAEDIRQALRTVMDPELGINIVDLGLVYGIEVDEGAASVTMSLTSPGCPAGGQILGGAKDAAETVEGIDQAVVSLVWKPFWTPERIDPKVRAMLGF